MDGLKWGMNNSKMGDLPFAQNDQSPSDKIFWQNGFDGRYSGDSNDPATEIPTKEILDNILSFISKKQFYAKCGGLPFYKEIPLTIDELKKELPISQNLLTYWGELGYVLPSSASFLKTSNGSIGMSKAYLTPSEKSEDNIPWFLNPFNASNLESDKNHLTYFLSVEATPSNGICAYLTGADLIYNKSYVCQPKDAAPVIRLSDIVDRSIAEELDANPPPNFDKYPNNRLFIAEDSYMSNVEVMPAGYMTTPYSQFIAVTGVTTNTYAKTRTTKGGVFQVLQKVDSEWKRLCYRTSHDIVLYFTYFPCGNIAKFSYDENHKERNWLCTTNDGLYGDSGGGLRYNLKNVNGTYLLSGPFFTSQGDSFDDMYSPLAIRSGFTYNYLIKFNSETSKWELTYGGDTYYADGTEDDNEVTFTGANNTTLTAVRYLEGVESESSLTFTFSGHTEQTNSIVFTNVFEKEVFKYDKGCMSMKPGYYNYIYMQVDEDFNKFRVLPDQWGSAVPADKKKNILIASGANQVCDRVFIRRGTCFDIYLSSNAPVDFGFSFNAIPLNQKKEETE